MTWSRPSTAGQGADSAERADHRQRAARSGSTSSTRAVLGANPTIAADPELAAAVSRSNQANLYFWATANVRDPGAPVPPNTGPEPMTVARELVRRGLDAYSLDAYRVGEGVAWRRLMGIAFELTSDPAELHELLDVCSRSISAFVDATLSCDRGPDRPGARRTHPRHACRTSRDRRADSRRRADHPTARRGPARLRADRTPHRGCHLERRPGRRPGPARRGRRGASGTPPAGHGR